jgi:1-aminocyclopropane-1-carboxylate deaminase/D-cysteine desulfhydrase-like pyridoxal-dependent ACC family enzyme
VLEELFDTQKSIIEELSFSYEGKVYTFSIKRDDLIDDLVSGNKWRKLKYNLAQAKHKGKEGVLTLGGAYSNHLVATAKASKIAGLNSIGIVRGEELNKHSNRTLENCAALGMELVFISREEYKQRNDYDYIKLIQSKYPNYFVVPEGGANYYGIVGCIEIANEIQEHYDHIFTAMGTGTTAAGLRVGLSTQSHLHVVSALKGNRDQQHVKNLLDQFSHDETETNELLKNIRFYEDQFGGYGKWDENLVHLVKSIYQETKVKTDLIYTAKVIHRIMKLIDQKAIKEHEKILMIHTGGVQGMNQRIFE